MATIYTKNGNQFRLTNDLDCYETLPVGTYTVKRDVAGFFLEEIQHFSLPRKIYGEATANADRILQTFMSRDSGTGVLLTGDKGSGKTLLVKMLSIKAREMDISTIVINTPFCGENFNTLIQSISQRALLVFDEFEKVYGPADQELMLTLLDGVYPTPKLFLLTCNNARKVNGMMINRPGRIFYKIPYGSLSNQFVREYCEDNLTNKQHIEQITQIVPAFQQFNFDMLKALIEEMNRYDETPRQALRLLNVKPEGRSDGQTYAVRLLIDGEKATTMSPIQQLNPMSGPFKIMTKKIVEGRKTIAQPMLFMPNDIVAISGEGNFKFSRDNTVLHLNRIGEKLHDYLDIVERPNVSTQVEAIDAEEIDKYIDSDPDGDLCGSGGLYDDLEDDYDDCSTRPKTKVAHKAIW